MAPASHAEGHTKAAGGGQAVDKAPQPEGRCTLADLEVATAAGVYTIPAHCTVLALSRSGIDAAAAKRLSHALRYGDRLGVLHWIPHLPTSPPPRLPVSGFFTDG